MAGESTIERISINSEELQRNESLAIFKIVDGLKEILEEDRRQKQPLFLSLNDKLLINLVKEHI